MMIAKAFPFSINSKLNSNSNLTKHSILLVVGCYFLFSDVNIHFEMSNSADQQITEKPVDKYP